MPDPSTRPEPNNAYGRERDKVRSRYHLMRHMQQRAIKQGPSAGFEGTPDSMQNFIDNEELYKVFSKK